MKECKGPVGAPQVGVTWPDSAPAPWCVLWSGRVASGEEEGESSASAGAALPAVPAVRVGDRVGPYLLLEELGRGGTATVYRAHHPERDLDCAVKVLLPRFWDSDRLHRRLAREARLLADLAHPNILAIWDAGGPPDAPPYLVTERVEGPTLAKLIQDAAPLPGVRVAELMAQIARGLAAAHRAGIIHRDLKPANVVLARVRGEERAKILDFGLARAFEEELHGTAFTTMHDLLGTPAYMSPEQIRDPSRVGPRSDLYSLGLIGYELFTGQRAALRPSNKLELLQADLRIPKLEGYGALGALLNHLLEQEAERRPVDADEVVRTLEQLGSVSSDLSATVGEDAVGTDALVEVPGATDRRSTPIKEGEGRPEPTKIVPELIPVVAPDPPSLPSESEREPEPERAPMQRAAEITEPRFVVAPVEERPSPPPPPERAAPTQAPAAPSVTAPVVPTRTATLLGWLILGLVILLLTAIVGLYLTTHKKAAIPVPVRTPSSAADRPAT